MQPKLAPKNRTSEAHYDNTFPTLAAACIGTSIFLSGLGVAKMGLDELRHPAPQSADPLAPDTTGNARIAPKRLSQTELLTLQSAIAQSGARLTLSEVGLATIHSELEALSRHYLPSLISATPGTLILGENVMSAALSEIDLNGVVLEGLVIMKSSLRDRDLRVLKDLSWLGAATIQTSTLSGEFLTFIEDKGVHSLGIINDHELAGFNWSNLNRLSDFKALEHLALAGKGLTINELRLIPNLTGLKSLSLSSSDVDSCALLESLLSSDKKYPNLETLYLPVRELSQSDELKLKGLKQRLRESRPGLNIY